MKWKVAPQLKWASQFEPARAAWARGERVIKLIGFESTEERRLKRADSKAHMGKGLPEASLYEVYYPLMHWGWDLDHCLQEIDEVGMPRPVKSACFFCPNQKPWEVNELLSPEDRARVIRMEVRAEPYNKKIRGLWRRPRNADGRPGSITEYIVQQGLPFMPLTQLEKIDPMPLNPNCQKFDRGYTFKPPHTGTSLRDVLQDAGHKVPGSIACEKDGCKGFNPDDEDDFHGEIVDGL